MAITYRVLYNQALNTIKSACVNVSNYSALPSSFKSGYSESRSSGLETAYFRINNPVSSISTVTVDNDFNSIMTNYGISSRLDQTTTARGLINFYAALASLVQAKVCICQARNSGKYICYETSHAPTTLPSIPEGNLIYATDTNTICNNIIQIIASNAKGRPITFSISI